MTTYHGSCQFSLGAFAHWGPGGSSEEHFQIVDLDSAKVSIDLLRMIKNKTEGNLTSQEEKLMLTTLTDLELNYADEVAKEKKEPKTPEASTNPPAEKQV